MVSLPLYLAAAIRESIGCGMVPPGEKITAVPCPHSLAQLLRSSDSVAHWSQAFLSDRRLYAIKQEVFNYKS